MRCVCLRLGLVILLGVTAARAEMRLCPVRFYLDASRAVPIPDFTPSHDFWSGRYGISGGMEIPWGEMNSLRLEGTYDEFKYRNTSGSGPLKLGPSTFASVTGDVLLYFTGRTATVRPYFVSGLGFMWGTVRYSYSGG